MAPPRTPTTKKDQAACSPAMVEEIEQQAQRTAQQAESAGREAERTIAWLLRGSAYATIGAADTAAGLVRTLALEAPKRIGRLPVEAPKKIRGLTERNARHLTARGCTLVESVRQHRAVQESANQTRVARRQLEAAAADVRAAAGTQAKAAGHVVGTLAARAGKRPGWDVLGLERGTRRFPVQSFELELLAADASSTRGEIVVEVFDEKTATFVEIWRKAALKDDKGRDVGHELSTVTFPRTVDGAGLDARNVSAVRVGWRANDREDTWRFEGLTLRADIAGAAQSHTFVDVHPSGSSRNREGLTYFENSRDVRIYSPQLPVTRFVPTRQREDHEELDGRTVEDLQQLAAEYGVPGRSQMTKAQLISALRVLPARVARPAVSPEAHAVVVRTPSEDRAVYEERTVDQLQKLATERGIRGRAQMNKNELITALCSIS